VESLSCGIFRNPECEYRIVFSCYRVTVCFDIHRESKKKMRKGIVLSFLLCSVLSFAAVKPCQTGTLESYSRNATMQPDGTFSFVCTQGTVSGQGVVTYYFPKDFYRFSGIAGIKASDITIRLDTNGPYTLLISSSKWNPGRRQQFNLFMGFSVSGAVKIGSMIHTPCSGNVSASIVVQKMPQVKAEATCKIPTVYARYDDTRKVFANVVINLAGLSNLRSFGIHFHP
jgi:hypothetical protein